MDEIQALISIFEDNGDERKNSKPKPGVLVVDDDESMRRGISRILSPEYEVTTAEDGLSAIDIFKSREFNAVVLDIKMPSMNGFDVCIELNKLNPDVPIIFYTAFQGEHDLQAILNIYKPFAYLDKGGKFDLADTVDLAVQQYLKVIKQLQYCKKLEMKIINYGLPLEDTKSGELHNIRCFVGRSKVESDLKNGIDIRDFNTRQLIGKMPDLSDNDVQAAIEACRDQWTHWRRLTVKDRLGIIADAGKHLLIDDSYDDLIPKSGWFSKKISIIPDRQLTAKWMIKSIEYMKWAFGENRVDDDIIEGVGTVGIIIQSSMFQTGAYGIIDALRAGNSVLVKLDSRDPYPEYLVGKTLAEAGAPVQIISVNTKKKPHIGRKIIDGLDKVVFMGNPYKIIEIVYGEAIEQFRIGGGLSTEEINRLKKELLIPAKVISYTAHIGGAYIDKTADFKSAIDDCVYSSISHYRSCKRLKVLVIHPDIYGQALGRLKEKYADLKIGTTSDPDADIVKGSPGFLNKFVTPYFKKAPFYGEIIFGAGQIDQPKIIEIRSSKLAEGNGIQSFLGWECMFPHLIVIKGDEKIAIYATRLMAERSHDGMILEYSVFSSSSDIFRFIEKYGYAFNYHLNEPTTWGLGNPDKNKFRFHQRRILAHDLAGTRVG